ncbi:gas vesicle protein [Paenibacillus phyllosphaerae]|uniref:Gas vesicle protein n=1 Tax=Paenibacillus phyllosphaerae TaxID=274593 RepID=A0A7W5ATK8_9BACL|nr:YtxH domain-containing protein [Paenibacillus phyllosphaerae]MBB3108530.1 gas vesicle protein [Paenibacillus phyllosphaerae]
MANAIKGILIGGAVGAVTALLLTPKTGKDMRESLMQKSSDLTAAARERATALASQAKDKASEARVRVNEIGKLAAEKVSTVADTTAGTFQQMKKDAEETDEASAKKSDSGHSLANGSSSPTTPTPAYQS